MPRYIALSVDSQTTRAETNVQREQHLVEQAVMLQDVDPGIDADQKRGPERHDYQHHRHTPPALAAAVPCRRQWDSPISSRIKVEVTATTRLRR